MSKEVKRYDVFKSYLVMNADYSSDEELPVLHTSKLLPNKCITFSEAMRTKDYNQWVVFYEHDYMFERIWNNPQQYLERLKRFNGVITPDFSLYRSMPLVMQKWSTYKSRAIGNWLYENGIEIIPNIRFADSRTYDFVFDGIDVNSTVSIGTHGCIKSKEDREYFIKGLKVLIERLEPKNLVVYGPLPCDIFQVYIDQGINIINFKNLYYEKLIGEVI